MKIQSAMDLIPKAENARKTENTKFRQAADMYEKQFLREMLKAMRDTVKPSGLVKQNFAEKIFREKLDEEYIQGWSNRGGVGLSDMIYGQLKDRFSQFSRGPIEVPQGPLPMQKSHPRVLEGKGKLNKPGTLKLLDTPQMPESSQFLFQSEDPEFEVTSPWSGKVSQVFALDGDRQVVEIEHDNGLHSKLLFEGAVGSQIQHKAVAAGEPIGRGFGESSTLSWKVTKRV